MSKLRVLAILALAVILSSCGGGGDSSAAVSPPPPNQAPTANAGADHNVDEGATVELSGSGADSDGTVVSYSWQQTSGPAVEITNANLPNAFFVAPMVDATQGLVFRLSVTDDDGATDSDTVTITVNDVPTSPPAPPPANNAPTAEISAPNDLSVYVVGDSIQFAGSGSDTEDGPLSGGSLVWESDIDGQIGTGTDFNSNTLSAGTHQISVTATDSSGATDTVTTMIRISDTHAEVYPSADVARASELYRVEIEIDGVWTDANAHQYARQSILWDWHQNASPWVHWTTIGVSPGTKVNVRVARLNRPSGSDAFTSVEMQPSRYGIAAAWNGDTITFTIEQNQKVYVRTNDQNFDTLFVFANPLKPPVPEGAKYFGPGVHDIGYDYHLLPNEQDVYLDGGAWVIGSIHTSNIAGDLRILGPGILSGEFEVWENLEVLPFDQTEHYMLIHADPVGTVPYSVFIEGPTLVASPWFNVVLDFEYAKTIRNLHIISPWTYNTDGLVLGSNLTVTNTFVFNADDTIHAEYLADGDIFVSDCVFGGRNSFLIGYGYFTTAGTNLAEASRIDLILQQGAEAFHAQVDGRDPTIVVDNQVYTDVVVDGDVGRLVYITIEDTPWGHPEPAEGNIRNITFNNITVKGVQESKSVIRGKDLNNRIDSITFNNLVINGAAVTEANRDQFFDIDDTTADVSFNP